MCESITGLLFSLLQGDFGIAYEGTSSKKSVMFESKLDTDLFDMAKAKTVPLDIDVSPKDGKLWAAICADRKIRIFRFLSGTYELTFGKFIFPSTFWEDGSKIGLFSFVFLHLKSQLHCHQIFTFILPPTKKKSFGQ